MKAGDEIEAEEEPGQTSTRIPEKKAPKQRPAYLQEDESYQLFSSVYIDRHTVIKLIANVVKELKVGDFSIVRSLFLLSIEAKVLNQRTDSYNDALSQQPED